MKVLAFIPALLLASSAAAQSTFRLNGRLDAVDYSRSARRSTGSRVGVGVALESAAPGGVGRIVIAAARASYSKPGWQSITAEFVPHFIEKSGVAVGLRLLTGAQHVSVHDLSDEIRACRENLFCSWSSPGGPRAGWAAIIGAAGEVTVSLWKDLSLTGSLGKGYVVNGPNAESRLNLWTIGLGYEL